MLISSPGRANKRLSRSSRNIVIDISIAFIISLLTYPAVPCWSKESLFLPVSFVPAGVDKSVKRGDSKKESFGTGGSNRYVSGLLGKHSLVLWAKTSTNS